ncbi:hypothetical protein A2W14_02820 [Candidatus Gottesmanbacteria bacterium RBG_16_37_8]|uniref:AlgX/AlgJ SGNH hydrolase-like domain-containing protein n=1 Tax=Candidatus Gottesmanbacteria bacterium RBG_16_37_8 TaxID=1798371 RepID=A0A1F5YT55_9BACT|nr:MAG: hypothetical protein A2W14_02820 [Candidatus Gottesmanbacteria bacterium RBG_16_37_8]
MPSKTVRRMLILFLSFFIMLFIAEFTVRKVNPQITFISAKTLTFDCFAKDDLLPFTLQKNYSCTMMYYLGDFNTKASLNSQGYRGREFSPEKRPGVKRILVLGDSVTFGHGVADEFTYPFQTEKILHNDSLENIEVINAGYAAGFSPDSYYLYLKERGLKLKPDIVLIGLFVLNDINDFSETVWEKIDNEGLPLKISSCCKTVDWKIIRNKHFSIKYRYPILRDSHLFILLIDTLQKKFGWFGDPAYLLTKGEQRHGCVLQPSCIHIFYPEETKLKKTLSAIKKITDENQIKMALVMIPGDMQLYSAAASKYNSPYRAEPGNENFIQKRLAEFFNSAGITYLDLYKVFDQERGRGYPYFVNDAHLNNLGNQLTAEAIVTFLKERNYLNN